MPNHMDIFQEFIVTSRYCKWVEEKNRRETWDECVDRYYDYIIDTHALDWGIEAFSDMSMEIDECREATKNLDVFPSMRA